MCYDLCQAHRILKDQFSVTRGKFDILKFLNEWYIVITTDVSIFANECQGQSGR